MGGKTMSYKLGKLAPKFHPKTLSFAKFLKADAPPPPPERTFWEYRIPPSTIGMYGNDTVGDCTCAEVAHHLMLLTAHTGKMFTPDPAEVLKMYSAISGYDPSQTDAQGNNPTDTGCAITDVMAYMVNTGLEGHKYEAWASIDPKNLTARNQGVYLFGGVNIGVQLPFKAQTQFSAGGTWTPVDGDTVEGGHCILESGYGANGRNFETWGKGDQKALNAWDALYTDEAYIPLTKDWIDIAHDMSPSSLNYAELSAVLAELKA
jgi:hypothetical protein